MRLIEVMAGRMRHLWQEGAPKKTLCGAHTCYGGWTAFGRIATPEDITRKHRCKSCERIARQKGLELP